MIDEALLNPPDFKAARRAQEALAPLVETADRLGRVRLVAGVDISSTRFDPAKMIYAAVVLLRWPGLAVVESAGVAVRASMPYVPGFLGFREVPALRLAWAKLTQQPDLVLVDGQGIAHPRGFGIAAHLGLVLDLPSIGVAKSLLVGAIDGELGAEPGATAPVLWQGRQVATALRTRARAGPLYISPGHRLGQQTALAWVQRCATGYRLPEPTRQAHAAANRCRRDAIAAAG